jgi:hypothetical protein
MYNVIISSLVVQFLIRSLVVEVSFPHSSSFMSCDKTGHLGIRTRKTENASLAACHYYWQQQYHYR